MRDNVRDHQTSLLKSLDDCVASAETTFTRERQHARLAFQKARNDFDMVVNSLDLHDLQAMMDTKGTTTSSRARHAAALQPSSSKVHFPRNTPQSTTSKTPAPPLPLPPLARRPTTPVSQSKKTPQQKKHPHSFTFAKNNAQSDDPAMKQKQSPSALEEKATANTDTDDLLQLDKNPRLEARLGELQQLAFHSAVQKALHDFASYVSHMEEEPVQQQLSSSSLSLLPGKKHVSHYYNTQKKQLPPLQVAIHPTGLTDASFDDIDLSVVSGNESPDLVDELLPRLPRPTTVSYPHDDNCHDDNDNHHNCVSRQQKEDKTPNLVTPLNALDQDNHQEQQQLADSFSCDNDQPHDVDHAFQPHNSQPDNYDTALYPRFHTFANHAPSSSQQQTKLDLSQYM
jgi:hypothetical protein